MIKYVVLTAVLFTSLHADLNTKLNEFFGKCGASANVNSADIYEGQAAGYLTGGGVVLRGRVMDSKLASVNLPRFDAGCGGIDIYGGGFSFISTDELKDHLKSIGSSAVGYAFLLGLETVSPQVANTMKQLQSWANTINGIGINSCETASTLVGSVWPKNTMASQHICRTASNGSGRFHDYIASRHNCSDAGQYDQEATRTKGEGKYSNLLGDEYNIAWEAIQQNSALQKDKDAAQLLMTLMGTVIVRNESNKLSIETLPSMLNNESFLSALLNGGSTELYACANDVDKRCLFCKPTQVQIGRETAWITKVQKHLLAMQDKVLRDVPLNQEEMGLLSKSSLPLYKIINVLTAYKGGHCPVDLYQVSDIVAMDLLNQYLREAIDVVREGAVHLKRSQMYCGAVDDYLDDLSRVERAVKYYETRTARQMEQEFQLMQKLELIEKHIASEIVL